MSYEVLARKWRPQVFEDVIGQEHITQTLMNAIKSDRLAHAYLFSGARGVGKTSIARILAKAINCREGEPGIPCNSCRSCEEIKNGSSVDVQEIDGASNRGIDEIRELRENIKYMPSSSLFRVYIIDEIHMLTLPAFNALLKTLEEPPSHVKFFFATTDPHKVPVTILSRCQRFDLKRISLGKIVKQLEKITTKEGIDISKAGLNLIAREVEGSMRDAESLLDQVVSYCGIKVDDKNIGEILGIIDRALVFEISTAIIDGAAAKCIEIVDQIYNQGYDIKEFYRSLMEQFRNLLVSVISPQNDLLDMMDSEKKELRDLATRAGVEKLQQAFNFLIRREEDLRYSSHPRLVLEAVLIKLCDLGEVLSFNELLLKLKAIEERLAGSSSEADPLPVGHISDMAPKWDTETGRNRGFEKPENKSKVQIWQELLDFLSQRSRAMANVLKEWQLLGFAGDTLSIGRGSNSFSSSYLDEAERLEKLAGYCKEFFKQDIKILVVSGEPNALAKNPNAEEKPKSEKKLHSNFPQPVQDVLRTFQGEIKKEIAGKKME
ncbi:DNA polymerase III subunit gamma/tau [Thermodesulfobacteriota bacterium]